jgi:hypothetical protein
MLCYTGVTLRLEYASVIWIHIASTDAINLERIIPRVVYVCSALQE